MNEVEAASAKAAFIAATDELIAAGRETGNWMSDQALQERNPVAHGFADGLYTRQIEMPAGQVIVGKVHLKSGAFFLLSGSMDILSESGVMRVSAPHHGVTPAGTQRVVRTVTDCVYVTVHATDLTDTDEIEAELTSVDFDHPAVRHMAQGELT
jgi:hypothetical protein